MTQKDDHVEIHIDLEPCKSPKKTTGEALYHLGHVPHGFELFKEASHDGDDELVKKDHDEITVHENEHFFSEKTVKIFVSTKPHEIAGRRISFEQVVDLAFPNLQKTPETRFTVAFYEGHCSKHEGTLTQGHSVKLRKDMRFDVKHTNRS
jgi:hypothetical protein